MMQKLDHSHLLSLIVVTCALFLDGLLVSIVIPIIPEYLSGSSNVEIVEYNENVTKHGGDVIQIYENSKIGTSNQDNSLKIGVLFAAKSFSQLITNPHMGHITNRFGCDKPLQIGFIVVFFSTLMLAFGTTYELLLFGRIIQGIGSSFLSVAGLAMLANRFTEIQDREYVMTYALGGLSLGFLIGAPYAGVVYDLAGKESVFLGVCVLAFISTCLQYFNSLYYKPAQLKEVEIPTAIFTLIKDPYILLTAVGIFFTHFALAVLETGLPIWLLDTMNLSPTLLGLTFFPGDVTYLLALKFYPMMMQKLERWLTALIGIFLMGTSILLLPAAKTYIDLILPMAVLGVANGMADTSLIPELAYLVDIRHTSMYGNVYAIGDLAKCASLGLERVILGPIICGLVLKVTTFEMAIVGVSILYILFTPCLWLLKSPPKLREETQCLIEPS